MQRVGTTVAVLRLQHLKVIFVFCADQVSNFITKFSLCKFIWKKAVQSPLTLIYGCSLFQHFRKFQSTSIKFNLFQPNSINDIASECVEQREIRINVISTPLTFRRRLRNTCLVSRLLYRIIIK